MSTCYTVVIQLGAWQFAFISLSAVLIIGLCRFYFMLYLTSGLVRVFRSFFYNEAWFCTYPVPLYLEDLHQCEDVDA